MTAPCWLCGDDCEFGLCDRCEHATDAELDEYFRQANVRSQRQIVVDLTTEIEYNVSIEIERTSDAINILAHEPKV